MSEITYKDIAQVNAELNYTDVKGKMYAEVPQRVKAFRMLYPRGYIITDMISNADGVCVFKATAGYYGENGEAYTLGTGTAYEREGSNFINKTSYIENCETSAVGRALGFLGLGSETSIASAEEVTNAINNQGETKKPKQYKCDDSEPAFPVCEACGRPIQQLAIGDKIVPPEQVAQMTAKKYGLPLCNECAAKAKAAKAQAPAGAEQ